MLHPHRSGIVMKNVKFSVSPRKNSPPVQKTRTHNDFTSQPSWCWAEVQCAHSMTSPLRKSVSTSGYINIKAAFPFSNSQVVSSFLGFKSTHCTLVPLKTGKLDGQSWQPQQHLPGSIIFKLSVTWLQPMLLSSYVIQLLMHAGNFANNCVLGGAVFVLPFVACTLHV